MPSSRLSTLLRNTKWPAKADGGPPAGRMDRPRGRHALHPGKEPTTAVEPCSVASNCCRKDEGGRKKDESANSCASFIVYPSSFCKESHHEAPSQSTRFFPGGGRVRGRCPRGQGFS